jgi:hypothetical protein
MRWLVFTSFVKFFFLLFDAVIYISTLTVPCCQECITYERILDLYLIICTIFIGVLYSNTLVHSDNKVMS